MKRYFPLNVSLVSTMPGSSSDGGAKSRQCLPFHDPRPEPTKRLLTYLDLSKLIVQTVTELLIRRSVRLQLRFIGKTVEEIRPERCCTRTNGSDCMTYSSTIWLCVR